MTFTCSFVTPMFDIITGNVVENILGPKTMRGIDENFSVGVRMKSNVTHTGTVVTQSGTPAESNQQKQVKRLDCSHCLKENCSNANMTKIDVHYILTYVPMF